MQVDHQRQLASGLNRRPADPARAGNKAAGCRAPIAPTDGNGRSIPPEKGAILEQRDEAWIVGLTRAIVEAAVKPHSAQCLVEAKARNIGTAPQSGTQVDYGGIICHRSVWSRGFGTWVSATFLRAMSWGNNPRPDNPFALGSASTQD